MRLEAATSSLITQQDLITSEILPRLPVKSLLRFKSVCKNWKTIISDNPNFTSLHLQFQQQNNKDHSLLYGFGKPWLVSIKDDPSQLGEIKIGNYKKDNHNHIIHNKKYSVSFEFRPLVLGSSNGLLCFLDAINGIYVLWNPATRTRRLIGAPPGIYSTNSRILCQGFGYSPSCDDYKIVILCGLENPKYRQVQDWSVYVFTTRTSAWRSVKLDPSTLVYSIITRQYPKPFEAAVQVGEALHWGFCSCLSSLYIISVILAFDLANDVIHALPLPEPIHKSNRVLPPYLMKWTIFVSKIRNRLCVGLRLDTNTSDDYTMEVWMLERYGEPESWKMFFTLKDVSKDYNMIHSLLEIKDNSGRVLVPLTDGKRYTFVVIDSLPPLAGLVEEPLSCVNQTQVTISPKHRLSSHVCAVEYIETLVSPFPHD